MDLELAQTTALKALSFLVTDEDLLPVFMGATGADQDAIRDGLSDPAFLGSVLDFLMMDDAWVMRVCDAICVPYENIASARQALPGGEQISWT